MSLIRTLLLINSKDVKKIILSEASKVSNNAVNKKVTVNTIMRFLLITCSLLSLSLPSAARYIGPIPNVDIKTGSVVARSIVVDPDTGQPILVRFNEDGSEAGQVAVPSQYAVTELSIVPAARYRFFQQQIADFNRQFEDTLARDAQLMTRAQFLAATFLTADNQTEITTPELPEGINSVLVRGQSNRLVADPNQLVLMRFTLDLTQTITLTDDAISLVVSPTGSIIEQSAQNIGFRTGFFGDPNEPQGGPIGSIGQDDQIFGPLPRVGITNYLSAAATNAQGQYLLTTFYPLCPPGGFNFSGNLVAELRYRNLFPTGAPFFPYYLVQGDAYYCNAAVVPTNDLIGAVTAIEVERIVNQQFSSGFSQNNFFVDVMFLTGQIAMINANGERVAVGETTRTAFEEPADARSQVFYDFNNDGLSDTVIVGRIELAEVEEVDIVASADPVEPVEVFIPDGDGDLQGIFFDGQQDDNEAPDLVRLIDREQRRDPIGLVDSISLDDLRNTDILFFRESTGQLIMERRGLKEAEASGRPSEVDTAEESPDIFYRVALRGPTDSIQNVGGFNRGLQSYEQWTTDYLLTEPFQNREADHLRSGEFVRIVAINRATGYVGTARTILANASDNGTGLLNITVPTITLQPPNLKIWAERNFDIEQGLTAGNERTNVIGSEGAALTSDTTITIYTEWLDELGQPLPDELGLDNGEQYGLTGRLATVVAAGQLQGVGAGSDLAEFAIAPGRNTQVINVGSNLTTPEQFYVHVIGKAKDQECVNNTSCPSFDTTGLTPPYDTRPNLLVPFLVPLPDEDRTWVEFRSYRALLANAENSGIEQPTSRPLPAYVWQYRPEYQFSQYELQVDAITRTSIDNDGNEQITNLLDIDSPIVATSDSVINVLYDLIASSFERLTSIDGPQELVLTFGQEEQRVTLGVDQTLEFENVDHITQLDPEDFLTLRLYTNNDASNVLFEYAFEGAQDIGFALQRSVSTGRFNAAANPSSNTLTDTTDSFLRLPLRLQSSATVDVQVLDEELQPVKSLITRQLYPQGDYGFVVVYEDIADTLEPGDRFYIAVNQLSQVTGETTRDLYVGQLRLSISSEILGQVIEHDSLIQRGALTLRREDVVLKGLGPQLNFIRSYNNEQELSREENIMGPGWSHNHDISLQVVAAGEPIGFFGNNLPEWIEQVRDERRPNIVLSADFPEPVSQPRLISVSNGGLFRLINGRWHASRGFHGSLEFVGDHYEYTAKDGTLYVFEGDLPSSEAELITEVSGSDDTNPEHLISEIIDRNGNRLRYRYAEGINGERLLERVTDAVGRTMEFSYIRHDNGGVRLSSVEIPQTDIRLSFSYSRAVRGSQGGSDGIFDPLNGVLERFARDSFNESYDYDKLPEDDVANLVMTTDAVGNQTRYNYLAPEDVPQGLLSFAQGSRNTDIIASINYPGNTGTATIDYLFTGNQNQRRITDLNGNVALYTLNNFGNPIRIDDSLGKTTQMTWTIDEGKDDVLMSSRTDALGRLTTYEYDSQGNITRTVDPIGTTTQTWNQEFSLLLTKNDRNGNITNNSYDDNGNLIRQTDAEGNVTRHGYNNLGQRVTSRHPGNGGESNYSYDNFGNMSRRVLPAGSTYTYLNDSRGRKTQQTDANGNVMTYEYDALDRLTGMTHPDGFTSAYTYDAKGNKLSETDKLGLSLVYTYDPRDRVSRVTRSFGGGAKNYTYDNNSNLLSETDWLGQVTRHTYDELDRRITTTNRVGDNMVMEYDLVNNLLLERDYRELETRHTYDDGDRRISTLNAIGDTMAYTYDNENNILTSTDYAGRITTFEYDRRYLQTRRVDAIGGEYTMRYDARNNMVSKTDEEGRISNYVYDRQNRKAVEEDALGFETRYVYDGNNNVIRTTDRRGFIVNTVYDEIDRPIAMTDEDGFTSRYTYDANNNRTSMEDGNGHITRYSYDTLNRLITQTTPVGGNISNTYDANNNMLSRNDAIGTLYTYTYDPLDRVVREVHASGNSVQRTQINTYDPNSNVIAQRNFRGFTTRFSYDNLDRVETVTDALNQLTRYSYDPVNNKLSETNRRGFTMRYNYDRLDRLTVTTDALGQTITNTYDGVGNVLATVDKRGTSTTHTYDLLNRLLSSTKPDGNGNDVRLIRNEYDRDGTLTAVTDANDNRTEYTYNGRRLQISALNPDNTTMGYTYDGAHNKLTSTDEIGQVMSYTYDDANRQLSSTNFANETTTYAYDLNNNRTLMTQPLGNTMAYVYDALNRIDNITDGENNTTGYTYDGNDNQLSHTDANGNLVRYVYDELDRQTQHLQPNNLVTTYSYDPEANMTGRVDANGRSFSYEFDAIDRETVQTFPTDSDSSYLEIERINMDYDPNNNVVRITEVKQNQRNTGAGNITDVTTMAYDLLDRETSNSQRGHNVNYTYDDNGNRLQVSSSGGSTDYRYDSRNRLISATTTAMDGVSTGNAGAITTYVYTGDSKQETVTYPNNTVTRYEYDNADRLTSVINEQTTANTVISSFTYNYDLNSNRTQQVETQNGFATSQVQTTDYTFDNTNRLTSIVITDDSTDNTQSTSYGYDNNYNRTSETETETIAGVTTTTRDRTSVFDGNNRLSQITNVDDSSTIDYVYDNNGNTLTKTDNTQGTPETTQFIYDSRNQLTQVIRGPPNSAQGNASSNQGFYDYNYRGQRIRHIDSERGDIDYIYDDQAVLEERTLDSDTSGANRLIAHYRYSDRLISLNTATDEQYYHYSALRTTANLTNTAGDIQVSYRTDIWGEITEQEGDSPNRQVFTGQEHDENTGLIYFGARYYDPDTGIFINQDSYLGESSTPPSLNRYLYAYGNPTLYIDRDGYESVSSMIDNAAAGCGAISCAGWALLQGVYQVSTLGFATVHDPVRDAYDRGEVSGGEYIGYGIGGGTLAATTTLATGRLATPFFAAAQTTRATVTIGATVGAVEGTLVDAITQGSHIGSGLKDEYNIGQTVTSATVGTVIGGGAAGAGRYLNQRFRSKDQPQVTAEQGNIDSGNNQQLSESGTSASKGLRNSTKTVWEKLVGSRHKNYVLNAHPDDDTGIVQESIDALVKARGATEISISELSKLQRKDKLSIVAHGSPNKIGDYTGGDLGQKLLDNKFKGKDIELLACWTGSGCASEQLADITKAVVKAPYRQINVLNGDKGVPQVRSSQGHLRAPGAGIRTVRPKENRDALQLDRKELPPIFGEDNR